MTPRTIIGDDDLNAFIDAEVDRERAAAIAEALAWDPDLAARVAAFKADQERLVRVYAPLADRPLPAAWLATLERHRRPRAWWANARAGLAAAAAIVFLLMGWAAQRQFQDPARDALVEAAVTAWRDSTGSTRGSSPSPDWAADSVLTATLGVALKTPDLSKMGFILAGVRVYDNQPAGQAIKIDYRDAQSRLFTLYLSKSPGSERFEMLKQDGTRICIWQDDVLSTVMVGDISAAEMLRLASLAYTGLSPERS